MDRAAFTGAISATRSRWIHPAGFRNFNPNTPMNTHKITRRLAASISALLLVSCSTVSVNTDADPQTNFSKYNTYALSSPAPGSRALSPSSFATLQSTLASGLAAKGIREAAKPSFVISYHIAAKNIANVYMVPNWGYYGGYGPGNYGYWPGYANPQTMISQYTEGTLILDFIDTATSRLIWRGTAVGIIGSQKVNQDSITEAVRKMLEDFPPKR